MSAFSTKDLAVMQQAIKSLCDRVVSHHKADLKLTHQNVLDLFAEPEHHALLWNAADIADCSPRNIFCVPWLPPGVESLPEYVIPKVWITLQGIKPPCAPRNPKLRAVDEPVLAAELDYWLRSRLDIGYNFGRVLRVLKKLDELCSSPRQVRFLWPAVASLATGDEQQALHDKLAPSATPPSTIPTITPELREHMLAAAGTLAGATLLGEPPDVTPAVHMELVCHVRCDDPCLGTISML